MRKIIALGVIAGLLVSLTACATSAPSGTCTPTVGAGAASNLLTATGSFGDAPTVSFPTPVVSKDLEVSVLSKGDGPVVYDGDIVKFYATQYDAQSGALAAPSPSYDTPTFLSAVSKANLVEQIFECVTVGSRLAVVVPPDKTIGTTSPVVYVIDVADSFYGKAAGTLNVPQAGFPSVVTAPNGTPGVTILNEAPPTKLTYATLVTGPGAVVKAGDTVLLHYSAFDWTTKAVISSTWTEQGKLPVARSLTSYNATSAPTGVSAGALKALIGKTVGSQVIVVMPQASYAGGIDFDASSATTLVIVYDILNIAK